MKKIKRLFVLFFILSSFLTIQTSLISDVSAQTLWDTQKGSGLDKIGEAYGVDNPDRPNNIQLMIAKMLRVALGFTGIIFMIIVVWGGFKYMMSRGNESDVSDAIAQIRTGVIGLIIIAASFAIATFTTDCVMDVANLNPIWTMCQ